MCVCTHVYITDVGVEASVFLYSSSRCLFESMSLSLSESGAHQFGKAVWPVCSRDLRDWLPSTGIICSVCCTHSFSVCAVEWKLCASTQALYPEVISVVPVGGTLLGLWAFSAWALKQTKQSPNFKPGLLSFWCILICQTMERIWLDCL